MLGTPAGFTTSVPLRASISPPPSRSCHGHFFHLHLDTHTHTHPLPVSRFRPSPLFHRSIRRFLASPLCPIAGVTVELGKNSPRCWSALHEVTCHLCTTRGAKNDTTGLACIASRHCVYTLCRPVIGGRPEPRGLVFALETT